jgi:hypothetical protein
VEFALVEEQVQEIDALVDQGRTSLNWNSLGINANTYFSLINCLNIKNIYVWVFLVYGVHNTNNDTCLHHIH